MKSVISKHLLLALACAALLAAAPAEARRDRQPRDQLWPGASEQQREDRQQQRISIERAIQSVQRATGGRILDARDQGDEYRIKVLTREGEVRTVRVDAYTGAMR
jgi:uncharacterized membrane protein YkoI